MKSIEYDTAGKFEHNPNRLPYSVLIRDGGWTVGMFLAETSDGVGIAARDVEFKDRIEPFDIYPVADIQPVFGIQPESLTPSDTNELVQLFGYYTERYLYWVSARANDLFLQPNDSHHRLRTYHKFIDGNDVERALIRIGPRRRYWFDKRLNKKLSKKGIEVRHIAGNSRHDRRGTQINFSKKREMDHVVKYLEDRYNQSIIVIYNEVSRPNVIERYNRIKSLGDHRFNVDICSTNNKSKLYEIVICNRLLEEQGMREKLIKAIEDEKLYSDKKISQTSKLSKDGTFSVYVEDEKIINRMKIMSTWKDIIKVIRVSDREDI